MRRRIISLVVALMMCFTVSGTAMAATIQQASGRCTLTNSGKKVTYSGYSNSSKIEDIISITIKLMELRNGTWYEIDRAYASDTKSDYVTVSDSVTVTGGYYYKVIGVHYSKTGSQVTNTETEGSTVWIGA